MKNGEKKLIKRLGFILLTVTIFVAAVWFFFPIGEVAPKTFEATFLGVKEYGLVDRSDVLNPENAVFRFIVDGVEKTFSINSGNIYSLQITDEEKNKDKDYLNVLSAENGAYPIQNMLHEGEVYRVTSKGDKIISCETVAQYGTFNSIIKGTSGKHTLKNFLQTALMPVGNVLYVFGGGWDWQDIGTSNLTRSIGVSELWTKAFDKADSDYIYRDDGNHAGSTYPFGKWNQYYYMGLDCAGYVGWVLYNTLYDKSLAHPGFVGYADEIAKKLADNYGLGTWNHNETNMRPGDVVSNDHHVYICLGTCKDGSAVILDSNIVTSKTGKLGGGVCFSVFSSVENDQHCEAYRLVSYYLEKYYPQWTARYTLTEKSVKDYMIFPDDDPCTGVFHWNIIADTQNVASEEIKGLADPEGLAEMDAEAILKILFKDIAEHSIDNK